MYKNRKIFRILLAVAVLVILTEGMVSAVPVTQSITYQGMLTNAAGNPLTGTYTVTFSLYEVSAGGTALATDTHSVQASKGLFNTQITADPSFFDGRALWLGIKVGADVEMTPRLELQPVPYALSLRPGAGITSSDVSPALNLQNKGGGNALYAYTTGPSSYGVQAHTTGSGSRGISVYTTGPESSGILAITSGLGSTAIYGDSAQDIGLYGIGKEGGYFTTNQGGTSTNDLKAGINIFTAYNYNPGLKITTSGFSSEGVNIHTSGNNGYGVTSQTSGNNSKGIYSHTTGSVSDGINIVTSGLYSDGVHAYSALGNGIYAEAGPSGGYAADLRGNVNVRSKSTGASVMELGEGLDYSEGFDVSGKDMITPGTVLIISPDNPGTLSISREPYDRKVAGIVAGANGLGSAVKVGGNQFDQNVALAGRVYCNVDATYGAVHPGDQLTTSLTPGYAMVVKDHSKAQGAILGKAMEPLTAGEKGQILVLITLQ